MIIVKRGDSQGETPWYLHLNGPFAYPSWVRDREYATSMSPWFAYQVYAYLDDPENTRVVD